MARTFWKRLAIKLFSPIPQDPTTVMLRPYKNAMVQLRPVVADDGVVENWVFDPDETAIVDAMAASAPPPPVLAPQLPSPANAPAGPVTAGFNPAAVPGL